MIRGDRLQQARRELDGAARDARPAPGLLALLVRDGALDENVLLQAVATELGLPCVNLDGLAIAADVLAVVPRSFVLEHAILPFACEGGVLQVAVSDPMVMEVFDSLAHVAGLRVAPALASADSIRRAISRYYESEPGITGPASPTEAEEFAGAMDLAAGNRSGEESQVSENDAPINQLVQTIIAEAIRRRASDIHLEPLERIFRVRYRIDGVLLEAAPPPKRLHPAIISRLKIMANISIAEKRLPQDGRIQVAVDGRTLDLRVSSLPTAHGESMVMRILDQEALKLGLPELGFLPDDQRDFERLIASPDGMVLVTGPTGSGKTTTLYACLHQLNQCARKIITVEEPVEYQISGINQVPVNAAIGMTFSAALRAMLRQAPNIVMFG